MDADPRPILPLLTGPTACGKTELALRAAERTGWAIVGADSRQAYHGLAVATAAPDAAQRARVPHHMVGHLDLFQEASAGRFAREARAVLGLPAEGPGGGGGRLPFLVCGGSGFYLHALLNPVDGSLRADPRVREVVASVERERGSAGLRADLLAHDPEAAWIAPADRVKLRRYLELCLATGEPATDVLRRRVRPRPVVARIVVLAAPVDWLDARIARRSRAMLETGMVEEVAAALAAGVPRQGHALRSVGVDEVEALLQGRLDLDACAAALTVKTRQLARRQRTWLRGLGEREPVLVLDATRPLEELVEEALAWWTRP